MNGKELFHETEDRFTYWYADGYGIHASLTVGAYQNMSAANALEVMAELAEIIGYCEQYQHEFGDL